MRLKKKPHFLNAVFFMMISIKVFSGSRSLPSSLLYNNTPIDALCFTGSEHDSLKNCGIAFEKDMEKKGQNKTLEKQGFIGYEYHFKNAGFTTGYSYYRPIGHFENKTIVLTVSSGGGSGEFTAIKTIERISNKLKIQTKDAGDRCNHGIFDVKKETKQITYRAHITPFDFLTITNENPHKLKAYEDLEACAACCAGSILIARSLDKNFSKATILSIDFSHYSLEPGTTNSRTYQSCFNSLITTYKIKHKTVLTLDELKILVQQFNKKCVQ